MAPFDYARVFGYPPYVGTVLYPVREYLAPYYSVYDGESAERHRLTIMAKLHYSVLYCTIYIINVQMPRCIIF